MSAVILILSPEFVIAGSGEYNSPAELKILSFEQLLEQRVTLISRRPESLGQAAAAVQVVSGTEIRRSGATSLPEALRLAPNLEVAQINSYNWAISARGFNNTVANKLLVMIDGRTIYTPLYAGVFWDAQHVLLSDLDRIEVVSGPGGTLWGANAVNGVINIVSKEARQTQGLLLEAAAGSLLQDFGAVRYGGQSGSNLFFRVYGQRLDRNSTVLSNGRNGTNGWDVTQGGFRLDWYPSGRDMLTVQGDVYSGSENRAAPGDIAIDGQNLLARWTRTVDERSDFALQFYFDRTWRNIPNQFAEDLKTYDLDFQHRFALGERQSIVWGGGYRLMQDDVRNSPGLAFLPSDINLQLFSAFVQDRIVLIPDRLRMTIGTKLEHNDYSGFEVQPSVRLAWTPDERQMIWAAISRAVRSPSRIDTDFRVPGTDPHALVGGSGFDSEKLLAYELGYRIQPTSRASLSMALFYHDYSDLRGLNTNAMPIVIVNNFEGQTYGVELSGSVQVTDWWRLRGGYTHMEKELSPTRPTADSSVREGNDPENWFVLQSMMNLPGNLELDLVGRYVDRLPRPHVPAYFTFDARLAWRATEDLEFSVVGQNLWDNRHPEFGSAASRQEIPRSVYGKVTWKF